MSAFGVEVPVDGVEGRTGQCREFLGGPLPVAQEAYRSGVGRLQHPQPGLAQADQTDFVRHVLMPDRTTLVEPHAEVVDGVVSGDGYRRRGDRAAAQPIGEQPGVISIVIEVVIVIGTQQRGCVPADDLDGREHRLEFGVVLATGRDVGPLGLCGLQFQPGLSAGEDLLVSDGDEAVAHAKCRPGGVSDLTEGVAQDLLGGFELAPGRSAPDALAGLLLQLEYPIVELIEVGELLGLHGPWGRGVVGHAGEDPRCLEPSGGRVDATPVGLHPRLDALELLVQRCPRLDECGCIGAGDLSLHDGGAGGRGGGGEHRSVPRRQRLEGLVDLADQRIECCGTLVGVGSARPGVETSGPRRSP